MKHVARAAGLSVMTVSLALRRDRSIPAATRDRIIALAEKVGYRRNPLVSALMAGLRARHPRRRNAHVIAYVESYPAAAPAQQIASLRRFHQGAIEGAARHGYALEVFRLGEGGLTEAQLERVLAVRGIRGVVFAPLPQTNSVLAQRWENHALAAVGLSLVQPRLHRAVNHQLHSIRLAIAELLALGYRRIGLALSPHEDARAERNWLSAVLLAQHENVGKDRSFPLLYQERIDRPALFNWLKINRPDVVISTESDVAAMLQWVAGRRAGSVGFAHLHLTEALTGSSGIDQNNERVGAAAVDLVVEQLHANSYGVPAIPKTVLIEGRWMAGTTAPGPAGAGNPRSRGRSTEKMGDASSASIRMTDRPVPPRS
jgi:DNA-binding LacI/PurR family transcriptional regulator